ncbi:MAG: DUF2892 domain-containing protein [Nitrospirae bacterium]|nr:DUF2892 domain-containing protein [Nitrospirota bacterium]
MTKNMGISDRIIRTIIAVILGILVITGNIYGTWGIILGAFAIILLLTSAIGWCPLYKPFGISTRKTK